ncbi:prepilin-type N-terminal cleavage/methylation domain-containing protein [Candidatus Parcubacteria bacterium]|nr:prepilin-type N-terminal cleavage/methylation domain-containing protein [Candidatus Parcubacteria bacterium]
MIKLNKKGFTLIELLVVIAIIGILASIVLVSLNDARNKGYDTQVKSDIAQIRNGMEICYDNNNGTYVGCTTAAALGITNLTPPACSSDNTNGYVGVAATSIGVTASTYAIHADLCAGAFDWCLDSTGTAKATAAAVGDNASVCP